MHTPAAVDELQLTSRHQLLHVRLRRVGLLPPPALEEGLLHVDELAGGIALQGGDDRGEDVLDGCVLDVLMGADVVLVHGLQPAHIVVRVRDQVDGQRTAQRQQCSRTKQDVKKQAQHHRGRSAETRIHNKRHAPNVTTRG